MITSIKDYHKKYFDGLNELISELNEDIGSEIFYDLIKLEDWKLPNLDELELYFKELKWNININIWKLIKAELLFQFHIPCRNELVIKFLQIIQDRKITTKPFVLWEFRFSKSDVEYLNSIETRIYKTIFKELRNKNRLERYLYEWDKQTLKELIDFLQYK